MPSPQPGPASAGEVLRLIRNGQATTRSDVARVTNLSRTAVTARLNALISSGLIVEAEEGVSTGGRPPMILRFNSASGAVLAAALGRSRTQLAVCDLEGRVLQTTEFEHTDTPLPGELLPRVARTFAALLGASDVDLSKVRGIGLSIPATVDPERGLSTSSAVMRGWEEVLLAPYFADFGPIPVLVENDANALALSERSALLTRFRDVVVVKASTGIGCGVVVGGHLVRGSLGGAGEVGHTKVSSAAGRLCRCGERGCLEAVAGGWALIQEAAAGGRPAAHIRELVARAASGDAEARQQIREGGRRVGEVLAGVVNVLNPEAVVIGGDMAPAYDTFVAGLRETLYAQATALNSRSLEILPSTHGDRAGLVGCAQLALDRVLSPASVDAQLQVAKPSDAAG